MKVMIPTRKVFRSTVRGRDDNFLRIRLVSVSMFVALGLMGCMPPNQHTTVVPHVVNTHMARCHGKGHHHNPRHDHSVKCLSGHDRP